MARRRLKLWTFGAVLLVLGLAVMVPGLQRRPPAYKFLEGLEPVYTGDRYREFQLVPVPRGLPRMRFEYYAVRGKFEDWHKKIGAELKVPNHSSTMPKTAQHCEYKWTEWDLEPPESPIPGFRTDKVVALYRDRKIERGQYPLGSAPEATPDPGWVTIAVLQPEKPNFLSRAMDWMENLIR